MPFFPQFSNLFVPPYVPPPPAEKILWLKADVGVSYEEESHVVTLWQDQSGNENNVTPYDAGYEPLWVDNSINSLPTIRFKDDDTTKLLVTPNFYSISYDSPTSIIAVLKANSSEISSGDAQRWFLPDGSSGSFELGITFGSYANANRNFAAMIGNNLVGETNIQSDTISGTETAIVSLVNTGSEVSFYKNGTLVGTTDPADYSGTNSTSGVWGIGGQMAGGNIYLSAKFNLAELIMYNSALGTAARESDESYLNTKWDVY